MSPHPTPAILSQYRVCDGALCPGGTPVSEWARRYGTPLYLYDRQAIVRRIESLRQHLPDAVRLYYAVKANPLPELLRLVAGRVDGMDVASAGELERALESGVPAARISFAGPGKRDTELADAIRAGAVLSIESEGELLRAARLGASLEQRPQVALRINPAFRLKASGMHMGGLSSPFGIDQEQAPEVLARAASLPVTLRGLHVYAGSQNLSAEHLMAVQQSIFDLALELAGRFPDGMDWLNIGGGFGIPYFAGEQALALAPVCEHLAGQIERLRARLGGPRVILELGRYLVGEAGIYLCRVIDRKVSRGQTYLITDGGMHQHLAASGNLGQVLRKNFPLVLATAIDRPAEETVNVVGPLCTPLDRLGEQVALAHAEPGDLIAVLQSGAYGPSASPVNFLGHPPAREILA